MTTNTATDANADNASKLAREDRCVFLERYQARPRHRPPTFRRIVIGLLLYLPLSLHMAVLAFLGSLFQYLYGHAPFSLVFLRLHARCSLAFERALDIFETYWPEPPLWY